MFILIICVIGCITFIFMAFLKIIVVIILRASLSILGNAVCVLFMSCVVMRTAAASFCEQDISVTAVRLRTGGLPYIQCVLQALI